MSARALFPTSFEKSAQAMAGRAMWLLLVAGLLVAVAMMPVPRLPVIVLLTAATTLFALVIVLLLMAAVAGRDTRGAVQNAQAFHASDIAPGFATDLDGAVLFRNAAAVERFGDDHAPTLARALGELFADPSSVIYRLQNRAEARGNAMEDVVTRRGHVRISVHRVGRDAFYWRFDEMEDRSAARGAETLSLPLMTVGRNGTVLFMNEAARTLLGGRARNAESVLGSGKLTSGVVMTLDGADGPFQARVIDISGRSGRREIYFLPVTQDEQSDLLDDQFFDAVPVALMKLAPDGQIQLANRLARNLLALPEGSRNFNQHVDGLGRSVLDWLDDVLKGRVANGAEVLRVQREDREIFVQVTLERVYDAGQPAIVAVLQDATELKALEAQFTQSQKMQAIGQLAGGVAHDFNNLLTAISGHCDLLLMRHEPDAPDYGDLMQIHQNANRAASLVGQLLAFSRKQTLRPELIDLTDVLGDLTHLLNRLVGETVRIELIHDPELAPIRADKRQLEQVIMNLVVNARDAMAQGGDIRIETETVVLGADLRRDRAVVPAGRYVSVRVADQGSGIPKDKIDKIFEPFFTTKKTGEGTGLGLSTAYGIVKQSGGFIFVDSQIGQGTEFTLYFPAREEALSPEAQPDRTADAAPASPDPVETPETLVLTPASRVAPATLQGPDMAEPAAEIPPDDSPEQRPPAVLTGPDEILFHSRRSDDRVDPDADDFNLFAPQEDLDEPLDRVRSLLHSNGIALDAALNGDGPPALDTVEAPEPASPTGDKGTGNGVVLLVEDEAPVRAFASRALRMRGFTVIEAENAEDALAALEDRALAVDVFVTDVVMPGMDGPSWVQQALQERPDTRVVFVSGYAEDSFSDTQSRIPNSVFLPKPFSLTELTSTVDSQMA